MPDDASFRDLVTRLRSGDSDAARELLRLYEADIRRAIRVRLRDPRLRRAFDSSDICQDVFGSFCIRVALGAYLLESPDDLIRLLMSMTSNKLRDRQRRETAGRRDYRRTRPMSPEEISVSDGQASPSQQVALKELIDKARALLTPDEQALAEERVQKHGWKEIAAKRGEEPDALRKKLDRAIERVERALALKD
jgi:RNA polymerase sigma factor (sigma-70 family)